MTKLLCIACLFLFASFVDAQTTNTYSGYQPAYFADANRVEKIKATIPLIESLYKEHGERNRYPAFAFGLVVDGQLIHAGYTGLSDVNKNIKASAKSVFRIASMSKSFAALAILQLRDAGRLKLDDPASKYVPELKKVKHFTSDAPPITVRNLLTHSAGFPEDNPWGDRRLGDTEKQLTQLIES